MRFAVRPLIAISLISALFACGRSKMETPEAQAPAIEISDVAAADGYGAPGETVNAVAFWSHPTVNFESLLLAGTDRGIDAYAIESTEKVAEAESAAVRGLAVIYFGEGGAARGYVIAATTVGYKAFSIDNGSRALSPVAINGGPANANGFCAGRNGDTLALYEVTDKGLSKRSIDETMAIGDAMQLAEIADANACHVDDRTGDVIVVSKDGGIRRVDSKSGEVFGLAFGKADTTASALMLMTTAEPQAAPGGAIALLDGENGVVTLFDLIDGHTLGAVRVKSTFDLEAVASAKAIGIGYGNYGGVYRDGALAIVTGNGDGGPIRLVPWNGVLDAVKQPLGENVDPRTPQPAEEDESVISIDLIEP